MGSHLTFNKGFVGLFGIAMICASLAGINPHVFNYTAVCFRFVAWLS